MLPDHLLCHPLSTALDTRIQHHIDQKTKPLGALGKLETLAAQVARIQQSMTPKADDAVHLVFAADHGICAEGVSPFPSAVTAQMVLNFLHGGAAINVFCRQNDAAFKVINAGVLGELPEHPDLVNTPVRNGTANFLHEPAMTTDELMQCLNTGSRMVDEFAALAQVISLGEMGIGNTTASAAILSALLHLPAAQTTGAGTGADEAMQAHKAEVIRSALQHHGLDSSDPLRILQTVGGLEIAMMTGAYLRAAALGKLILVDGFIATSAWAIAAALQPALRDYSVFAHQSNEHGHAVVLQKLEVLPLLHLDMRLGEGTGAIAALPLVRLAVAFFNEMASFADAGVSESNA
ncbi:nicotinate-nucleotide--dimethylbenzimidazole phosphoribosyltransferase [Salinispirillum sp. LH 10-3-1]|uniref:Nicotinate-nucleotide--dimethylbenzimidazole phosphoribosyltransferase n=1 Tax=Salinispirillum sp. LH 10-3-1 TaxID=2952525 RepID=A0AB38YIG0_9GAMM